MNETCLVNRGDKVGHSASEMFCGRIVEMQEEFLRSAARVDQVVLRYFLFFIRLVGAGQELPQISPFHEAELLFDGVQQNTHQTLSVQNRFSFVCSQILLVLNLFFHSAI